MEPTSRVWPSGALLATNSGGDVCCPRRACFDDHGLAQRFLQLGREQARDDIGCASGV